MKQKLLALFFCAAMTASLVSVPSLAAAPDVPSDTMSEEGGPPAGDAAQTESAPDSESAPAGPNSPGEDPPGESAPAASEEELPAESQPTQVLEEAADEAESPASTEDGAEVEDGQANLLDVWPDGGGTADDPYLITNEAELRWVSEHLDEHYKLENDITLTSENWTPIGTTGSVSISFSGTFDGNGRTISNLRITDCNQSYAGLFGRSHGVIKNLTLSNVSISVNLNPLNCTLKFSTHGSFTLPTRDFE